MLPGTRARVKSESLQCCDAALPNARDQAMRHPSLVVGIPGQALCEEAFFVEESPDQERHRGREWCQPPVRTEREGRAEQEYAAARIHRMADDRVRPGRD